MDDHAEHRLRPLVLASALAVALLAATGCNSPTPPPTSGALNLQGLWQVTPADGTSYGSGGTTTLEFGAATSGFAAFLSQADSNDITRCERHVFAVLSQSTVLLDDDYYIADMVDADTIVLDNDTDSLTLERVTGAPPVEPCRQATVALLGTYSESSAGFTSLSAFGTRLYFNIDDNPDSIVSFDTSTNSFGPARQYTQSVQGGTHRMVVAARSDDLFYGHCACGGSTSVDHFNLGTDASIADIDTEDLGEEIGVRHGYFADGMPTIGGRSRDDSAVNLLLTLDPDTLALVSQREILPAASIDDTASLNGQVVALVNGSLVLVGLDGRADSTLTLEGVGGSVNGIAAIGSLLYVVVDHSTNEAGIYEVALP